MPLLEFNYVWTEQEVVKVLSRANQPMVELVSLSLSY